MALAHILAVLIRPRVTTTQTQVAAMEAALSPDVWILWHVTTMHLPVVIVVHAHSPDAQIQQHATLI